MEFNRYQSSEKAQIARRMPKAEIKASTSQRTIGELLNRMEVYSMDEASHKALYPWADRFVMGYPLPKWQRPLVWTDSQKVKFIESLWMEVDVGSYLVNDVCKYVYVDGVETEVFVEFCDVLLDGQQRLTAMEDYFLGKFAVNDANGIPTYWHDLSKVERRFFSNQSFSRSIVHSLDESELRRIYDLRAFGGTQHTTEQRASLNE